MSTSGRGVGQRNPKMQGCCMAIHRESQWSRQRTFQMGDAGPLCVFIPGIAQHLVFVCIALWPVQYRIPWITYGSTGHGK